MKRRGEQVHLTPVEYRLLLLLIANAGKVLTHRYILQRDPVGAVARRQTITTCACTWATCARSSRAVPAQPKHLVTKTAVQLPCPSSDSPLNH